MGFRWHEPIDVNEFPDADGGAYELLYGFGFDTEEECETFSVMLSKDGRFDAIVQEIARAAVNEKE